MGKELATKQNQLVEFSNEQVSLIKTTILGNGFTDGELSLFVQQCKRTGLDPFTRQIYATKIGGKMNIQATIDGLRLIAERSGKYAGQTRPTWFDKDGKEYRIWTKKEVPYACEIGVLKGDFKEPIYAIAIFDEYAQKVNGKLGFMWEKMPALMISKVAEALALRRAFPNDLSGIYSTEEMQQAQPQQNQQTQEKEAKPINAQAAIEGHKTEDKQNEIDPGEYVVQFGQKFKGRKISDILPHEHESMLRWLEGEIKKGKTLSPAALEYSHYAEAFLAPDREREPMFNDQEQMPG